MQFRALCRSLVAATLMGCVACSGASGTAEGTGGSAAEGGSTGSGGDTGSGGSSASGGNTGSGGNTLVDTGSGGSSASGGNTGSGGVATGGPTGGLRYAARRAVAANHGLRLHFFARSVGAAFDFDDETCAIAVQPAEAPAEFQFRAGALRFVGESADQCRALDDEIGIFQPDRS